MKLITLKPNAGLLPTQLNIIANPLQLKIMELEGTALPHVLDYKQVQLQSLAPLIYNN